MPFQIAPFFFAPSRLCEKTFLINGCRNSNLHSGICRQGCLSPQATRVLTWAGAFASSEDEVTVAFYLCNTSKSQAWIEFQLQSLGIGCDSGVEEWRRLGPGETRLMLLGPGKVGFSNQPSVWLRNLGAETASYECLLLVFGNRSRNPRQENNESLE